MKFLTLIMLFLSFSVFSQDKEGDLQLPVTDVSKIQKQEEMPPTIDEVEMEQEEPKTDKKEEKQQSEAVETPKRPKS